MSSEDQSEGMGSDGWEGVRGQEQGVRMYSLSDYN